MSTTPGMLRGQAVRHAPSLCMTATATTVEVKELTEMTGFRDQNTVVLSADPVQSQFNIVRVERPPNIRGTCGVQEMNGTIKPGLGQLMRRLIFDKFVERIKEGLPVKKSLWLCRKISDVADL